MQLGQISAASRNGRAGLSGPVAEVVYSGVRVSLHFVRPSGQRKVDDVKPGQYSCQNRPQDRTIPLPRADNRDGRTQADTRLGDGGCSLVCDLGNDHGSGIGVVAVGCRAGFDDVGRGR
jgi:hypothetical protein